MPELSVDTLTLGLIWFVVFLFSTTCHEGAHALVAKLGGDPTASGQVTLNPIPHMQREPVGMVVVPLLSFFLTGGLMGWASAPYDPVWAHRHPHRAARMALAGPAANFTLMILAAVAIRAGVAADLFQPPTSISNYANITEAVDGGAGALLATVLSVVFVLNLLLGILNLFPLTPLDGSVAIGLLMSEERARRFYEATRRPKFALIGVVLIMTLFREIFGYIFWPAVNLLYYPIASYS